MKVVITDAYIKNLFDKTKNKLSEYYKNYIQKNFSEIENKKNEYYILTATDLKLYKENILKYLINEISEEEYKNICKKLKDKYLKSIPKLPLKLKQAYEKIFNLNLENNNVFKIPLIVKNFSDQIEDNIFIPIILKEESFDIFPYIKKIINTLKYIEKFHREDYIFFKTKIVELKYLETQLKKIFKNTEQYGVDLLKKRISTVKEEIKREIDELKDNLIQTHEKNEELILKSLKSLDFTFSYNTPKFKLISNLKTYEVQTKNYLQLIKDIENNQNIANHEILYLKILIESIKNLFLQNKDLFTINLYSVDTISPDKEKTDSSINKKKIIQKNIFIKNKLEEYWQHCRSEIFSTELALEQFYHIFLNEINATQKDYELIQGDFLSLEINDEDNENEEFEKDLILGVIKDKKTNNIVVKIYNKKIDMDLGFYKKASKNLDIIKYIYFILSLLKKINITLERGLNKRL